MENLEAYINWKHDPICKRNGNEWIRYVNYFEHGPMEHTVDGGATWRILPWKMGMLSNIGRALQHLGWPPWIDCFGWYNGQVAVGLHNMTEEEINIGKYLALFDMGKQSWSLKLMGAFDLADGTQGTWFEDVGFEIFNRLKPRSIDDAPE